MKTFLRRLEILNFLKSTKQSLGTETIVQHLADSGYLDASASKNKSQFRLIQRDLNFLLGEESEPNEYDNDFGLTVESGLGNSHHWCLDPYAPLRYDFEQMPAFMALALSVTQKHLKQVLPSTIQHELKRIFLSAESKLHQSEQKISPLHYQRLTNSVEFFQRGQHLETPSFDINVLDTVYRAILSGKRLSFHYRSKEVLKHYDIHPFGVVIMLPKLYLIGKKDADILKGEEAFRSFLIHKIDDLVISQYANQVPEAFQLKSYLEKGNMDVRLDNQDTCQYNLILELNTSKNSNLISDLKESPISADQKLEQLSETKWQLTAKVRRTIQLKNWLLSLGQQAKVSSPLKIKHDLLQALDAIKSNYD